MDLPIHAQSLQKKAKGSVGLILKLAYYRVTVEVVAGLALGLFFKFQSTHAYRILEEIDYGIRQDKSPASDTSSLTHA